MAHWDKPPSSDRDEGGERELETVGEPVSFATWSSSGPPLDPLVVEALAHSHNMNVENFMGVLLDHRTLLYKSKDPSYYVVHIPAAVLGSKEPSKLALPVSYFPQ